ncbi:MAG: hypothetical protein B0D88_09300, partial [Candidatus Sedimenticola endophacoides]
ALEGLAGSELAAPGLRPARARLKELDPLYPLLSRRRPQAGVSPQAAPDAVGLEIERVRQEPPPDQQPWKTPSSRSAPAESEVAPESSGGGSQLDRSLFKVNDIRGVAGRELSRDAVYQLGRAIGSEAYEQGMQSVIVGRDGRESSEGLMEALCRGLVESGRDVVRIGQVPTPVFYFATRFLGSNAGVMVSAGHSGAECNGLKVVIGEAPLGGEALLRLGRRIERGDTLQGNGLMQEQSLIQDYLGKVGEDIHLARPMKVVVDSGNGVAALVAPELFRRLGCEVVELFSEIDGSFPNHGCDPARPENLKALISMVQSEQADIGFAFSADGNRLGVVDADGKIFWPDRLLMLFARDVLTRHPGGDVLFDVKSTRHLAPEVLSSGGRPLMVPCGYAGVMEQMGESGALLAGEMSGHLFFRERWFGFDDAIYAAARLLEIVSGEMGSTAELFAGLPESVTTPEITLPSSSAEGEGVLAAMAEERFEGAKLVTVDGLRFEFPDGWGLVRRSNTAEALCLRFEADSGEALARIQ